MAKFSPEFQKYKHRIVHHDPYEVVGYVWYDVSDGKIYGNNQEVTNYVFHGHSGQASSNEEHMKNFASFFKSGRTSAERVGW